jgi:UDP-glucose 4-epimerase
LSAAPFFRLVCSATVNFALPSQSDPDKDAQPAQLTAQWSEAELARPSQSGVSVRVCVTGGAGFIGSAVVRSLADAVEGISITVLDDLSSGSLGNLDGLDYVDVVEGSIVDRDLCVKVVSDCDAVVHLAARPSVPRSIADPVASYVTNIEGTFNMLEAARALGASVPFVFASSSSVYGGNKTMPKREDLATAPLSPYAAAKLSGEQLLLSYKHSFGIQALALRFFNVFGPRQIPGHAYAAVVPQLTYAALRGEPLPIHGDGLQTRDFTYVDTVAGLIARAVVGGVSCDSPVNLAFGTRTSVLDVAQKIARCIGTDVVFEHGPTRAGDVRDSQADCSLLRSLFPDITPITLDEGIANTVTWMRDDYLHLRA